MAFTYELNGEINGIFKIRRTKNKYKRKKANSEKRIGKFKKANEKEISKQQQAKAPIYFKSGKQNTNEDIKSIPAATRRYNKLHRRKKRFTNKRPNKMAVKDIFIVKKIKPRINKNLKEPNITTRKGWFDVSKSDSFIKQNEKTNKLAAPKLNNKELSLNSLPNNKHMIVFENKIRKRQIGKTKIIKG